MLQILAFFISYFFNQAEYVFWMVKLCMTVYRKRELVFRRKFLGGVIFFRSKRIGILVFEGKQLLVSGLLKAAKNSSSLQNVVKYFNFEFFHTKVPLTVGDHTQITHRRYNFFFFHLQTLKNYNDLQNLRTEHFDRLIQWFVCKVRKIDIF